MRAAADADDGTRYNFVFAMHLKMARGGSAYVRRCEDFGITMTDVRNTGADPWRRVFVADDLEGMEFTTLRACVDALRVHLATES